MSNEAPYQVNLKTPRGSLLNLRAWDEQQFDQILDGLEVRIQRILVLEETIGALHNLSEAGLKTEIASVTPTPATQPPFKPQVVPAFTPASPSGMPTCDHGDPMRFVAAGISKAGKPYKAFYACPRQREDACSKKVTA